MKAPVPLPVAAFEAALALAGIGCWYWDPVRRGIAISANFADLLGLPPDNIPVSRIDWHQCTHPDDHARLDALIDRLNAGEAPGAPVLLRLRHGDGSWRRLEARATPLEHGTVVAFRDISENYRTRRRLEAREADYRSLVETSPDAILLLTPEGRLTMANQQAGHLFGIDPLDIATRPLDIHQLLGDTADQLLHHPEENAGLIASLEALITTARGRRFPATIAHTTLLNRRQRASGIVLFIRDISDRKAAEVALAEHHQQLEQAIAERTAELADIRDALAQIIDGSAVPTLVLDQDHRITHWNRACELTTGICAAEVIGTRDQWKPFYPQPRPIMADLVMTGEMEKVRQLYADRYRRSQIIPDAYEGEGYFNSLDRWLFFTAAPLRDNEGQIIGAIETLQDITERKRSEIALEAARQAAEAAARAKSEFVANMSHEIRTPMNAIIGLSNLLLKSCLDGRDREYVSRIQGAGQMLLGLINDILDFSKIDAGRMTLDHAEFCLDDILDNLSAIVVQRVQEKGLELQYDVAADVPPLLVGDPLRLSQILVNLVGNAIKFTASGTIGLAIRSSPHTDGRLGLHIEVQDTGIGMTPEQVIGLFQPFTQADTSTTRKYGGTGLGLVICRRLAQLMAGDIRVTSQLGSGSTFSVDIVLDLPHRLPDTTLPSFHKRFLVVDDNPLARTILARLLQKYGCQVTIAESGEHALQQLDATPNGFDYITIDLNMPGMNGLELADAVRDRDTGALRLVLITASETAPLESDLRLQHFDAMLNKPVTASQIQHLLETPEPRAAAESPAPLAGMCILVVEDIPTNQLIAGETLAAFGATVLFADNGRLGVEAVVAQGDNIDLVLMDMQMPEMDGLEATRRIRALERWADLPIVAMTAHAFEEERQRCLATGMQDFITKPIDPDRLLTTLLQHRRPKRAAPLPLSSPLPVAPPPPPRVASPAPSAPMTMTSPDGLPPLPGINTPDGLRRMMNKPKLYEKVLRDFHARFRNQAATLQAAIAAGDFETAHREAHSTKGLAGTIAADNLQAIARTVEEQLKGGTPPSPVQLAEFEQALREVIDGIACGFAIEN